MKALALQGYTLAVVLVMLAHHTHAAGVCDSDTQNAFVGKPAPEFTNKDAVLNGEFVKVSLEDYKDKWLILFFYPMDFTFVCPTEIIAFSDALPRFRELGAEVVGASVDSKFTHKAWTETQRSAGGLGEQIHIPLIADFTKEMSCDYGVLIRDEGFTMRALFIIDPKGVVRQITINDPPVGRNVEEVLRLLQAFQFHEEHGEVCPINWKPGDKTISPDPRAKLEYFEAVADECGKGKDNQGSQDEL